MAGCETLLLLNLHRAVKFHYETGEHLDCCLGQDMFNPVLMVLRCHPAPRNILCAAEASSSGQMKIWSCSFSKRPLITYHTLDAVLRVQGVGHQLRQGPWSLGEFTLQQRRWFVSVWKTLQRGRKGAAEEVESVPRRELRLEAQWTFWKEVNSVLSFGESEYVNIQGRKIFVFIETFMILNYRKPILIKLTKTKGCIGLFYWKGIYGVYVLSAISWSRCKWCLQTPLSLSFTLFPFLSHVSLCYGSLFHPIEMGKSTFK